jgi:hypothetical protein
MISLVKQEDVAPVIEVDFHGVTIIVPVKYHSGALAMSKDGSVIAMRDTPELMSNGYWTCRNWGSNSEIVAKVRGDLLPKDSLIFVAGRRK